ncbi:periplasmic chaperone for outer membrane proteins Skp [Roseomonas rosea]|uniref:Periplasmic chaperone for outer membrane proteins Skp n=1 Tax=Muricoccus roseus TaxID=198092 RepID=A0A1M6DY69_9PROT|nr:OmpH family outer membrane protein [Roseomonas rosea]SHI78186.1 periplasmic chaperone for outer membrane proteins Skp [Roseomonas rosea]
MMTARPALAALAALLMPVGSALAQSDPGFFIPPQQGGGQARPAQAQPRPAQPQRPPQQAQRPTGPNPAPLPPGQPPPAAVIGIVDVPELQRNSTAFNGVREEIEKRRQKLNDDLQREQTRWREEQQALANQRATMNPEQLRQKERELQERITDSQRVFRDRSRAIEQVAQGALQEIEQAMAVVIRQVAASRNVNLVLPRPLVIFNDAPFDLTDEISAQINRVLRSVTLPPEGQAPAQPAAQGQGGNQPAAQRPAQAPAQQQRR